MKMEYTKPAANSGSGGGKTTTFLSLAVRFDNGASAGSVHVKAVNMADRFVIPKSNFGAAEDELCDAVREYIETKCNLSEDYRVVEQSKKMKKE
jgi:hypothetical protein